MASTMNAFFRRQKLVFLIAAKCGSTALYDAMGPLIGATQLHRRTSIPKISARDAFDGGNRGMLRFAVARNPFDRLVSCWKDKVIDHDYPNLLKHGITRGMSFDDFIEMACATGDSTPEIDPHIRPQTDDWLWNGKPCWDELLHLETLEEQWPAVQQRIFEHCRTKLGPLRPMNTSPEKGYPEHGWDQRTVALVQERYARDFELLGYDTLPPDAAPDAVEASEAHQAAQGEPEAQEQAQEGATETEETDADDHQAHA